MCALQEAREEFEGLRLIPLALPPVAIHHPDMNRAAEQRRATEIRILTALREIGCGNLGIDAYPSGVVVNDGDSLWTARPGDILAGVRKVKAGLDAISRGTDDPAEHGFRAYDRLCSFVPYMARGDATAKARHGRCVKAWRRDHPGRQGNWT